MPPYKWQNPDNVTDPFIFSCEKCKEKILYQNPKNEKSWLAFSGKRGPCHPAGMCFKCKEPYDIRKQKENIKLLSEFKEEKKAKIEKERKVLIDNEEGKKEETEDTVSKSQTKRIKIQKMGNKKQLKKSSILEE